MLKQNFFQNPKGYHLNQKINAVLILDEPMSGLDPDGRILIKDILKSFKEGFFIIFKLNIFKLLFKRPIIRNGITLKKLPRN